MYAMLEPPAPRKGTAPLDAFGTAPTAQAELQRRRLQHVLAAPMLDVVDALQPSLRVVNEGCAAVRALDRAWSTRAAAARAARHSSAMTRAPPNESFLRVVQSEHPYPPGQRRSFSVVGLC